MKKNFPLNPHPLTQASDDNMISGLDHSSKPITETPLWNGKKMNNHIIFFSTSNEILIQDFFSNTSLRQFKILDIMFFWSHTTLKKVQFTYLRLHISNLSSFLQNQLNFLPDCSIKNDLTLYWIFLWNQVQRIYYYYNIMMKKIPMKRTQNRAFLYLLQQIFSSGNSTAPLWFW